MKKQQELKRIAELTNAGKTVILMNTRDLHAYRLAHVEQIPLNKNVIILHVEHVAHNLNRTERQYIINVNTSVQALQNLQKSGADHITSADITNCILQHRQGFFEYLVRTYSGAAV